uniref:hypothetical protein n=1 Tax=Pseudomonas sp. Kh7 TaxID=2093743 RepID=UPI0011866CED
MNITQRSSGTWRARVYAGSQDGKSIYKSITGDSRKEVEFLAAQFQMEQTQKKIDMAKPVEQRMSVGDAIDQYID